MSDRFPLYDSAEKGDLPGVKQHLTAGNVNQKGPHGWTPLNIAAWNGHPDVAAYLVKQNASIHSSNEYGFTPLHQAANNNNPKVVEFLLGCDGIDVTAVATCGKTALQDAEDYGNAECATLIKAFIADPAAFAEGAAARQQARDAAAAAKQQAEDAAAAAKQQAADAAAAARQQVRDAPMLAAFPVATASEIAADVYAASEEYNSKMAELVARAKAVVAKQEGESAASAGTAAAGDAHDDDVARLTAELAALKAAKDFKGMKAAKAALEAAKV
eukprot:gene18877-10008_t